MVNLWVIGIMIDVYFNIVMVKLFVVEDSEVGVIWIILGEIIDIWYVENWFYIFIDSGVNFFNVFLVLVIVVIGFWGMIGGWVMVGDFVVGLMIVCFLFVFLVVFIGVG